MKPKGKADVPRSGMHGVLADTCFWIAAFDPSAGSDHKSAAGLLEDLSRGVVLMPWPIMYEVLRTHTVRNPKMMDGFARVVRRPKVYKIDDGKYRKECLEEAFLIARRGRPISLVDLIMRAVPRDDNYRVTQLLTYDQRDFVDVCRDRGVTMWPPVH